MTTISPLISIVIAPHMDTYCMHEGKLEGSLHAYFSFERTAFEFFLPPSCPPILLARRGKFLGVFLGGSRVSPSSHHFFPRQQSSPSSFRLYTYSDSFSPSLAILIILLPQRSSHLPQHLCTASSNLSIRQAYRLIYRYLSLT